MKYCIFFFVVLIACVSSSEKAKLEEIPTVVIGQRLSIDYASAFDIEYRGEYKIVTIKTPWQGSKDPITYVLRHMSTSPDLEIEKLGKTIIIPIEKVVCNSTSQIVLLEKLGLIDKLKGFPQTKYIYSSNVLDLVKSGRILEVGMEAKLNVESILGLDPDVMMAFNMGK